MIDLLHFSFLAVVTLYTLIGGLSEESSILAPRFF